MKTSLLIWPEGAPLFNEEINQSSPLLDCYTIESDKEIGAIIVCPGGGYAGLAPHEGEPIARWLNSIGISAFVLNYRLAPYKHPVPLMDAQRAIRYVRHHAQKWSINPRQIGILGFSAGGHLASTAATHFDHGIKNDPDPIQQESSRPDLSVLCYPVISFQVNRHQGSMDNLIGFDAPDELKRHLSSELQVSSETPPTFLWHTADDAVVSVENSIQFAQALGKHNIPYEMQVYESGPHGMGLAEDDASVRTWTFLCEQFIKRRFSSNF
ncbi:alpha/beta hydrolase [Paenibacillus eucommiae]|uniref:Acetyl esterase/lipase n=1 Tax=Paenibacillus eucommiae TaxID=1355755 RepID=A0ABS4IQV0_9BACL|nr:alpha/beta hydrolase [Paenibacillus eucommiae]MBP1989942.1 acetyl esterase/lipase [Paenibacillus eucommiae]